jgi:hypothetical protein
MLQQSGVVLGELSIEKICLDFPVRVWYNIAVIHRKEEFLWLL